MIEFQSKFTPSPPPRMRGLCGRLLRRGVLSSSLPQKPKSNFPQAVLRDLRIVPTVPFAGDQKPPFRVAGSPRSLRGPRSMFIFSSEEITPANSGLLKNITPHGKRGFLVWTIPPLSRLDPFSFSYHMTPKIFVDPYGKVPPSFIIFPLGFLPSPSRWPVCSPFLGFFFWRLFLLLNKEMVNLPAVSFLAPHRCLNSCFPPCQVFSPASLTTI